MGSLDLHYFRKILLEKRHEIMRQIRNVKNVEMENSQKEANGDLSGYSFHLADQGSDSIERDRTYLTMQHDSHSLREIDDALDKIDEGTYGLCELCDSPIDIERLKYIPETSLCKDCKAGQEGMKEKDNGFRFSPPPEMYEMNMMDDDFE